MHKGIAWPGLSGYCYSRKTLLTRKRRTLFFNSALDRSWASLPTAVLIVRSTKGLHLKHELPGCTMFPIPIAPVQHLRSSPYKDAAAG